jgi:hypothetical protein
MKTFENLAIEFKHQSEEKQRQIQRIMSISLMDRINRRGVNEQYSSIMLLHYFPNLGRVKSRNTSYSNGRFYCTLC